MTGATGSDTITSNKPVVELFNQAALSMGDASGAAHVLVPGGNNVNARGGRCETK